MKTLKLSGALFGLALLTGPVAAQTAPIPNAPAAGDSQTFEDWGVHCVSGAAPPCEMFQFARNQAGRNLMSIAIAFLPRQDSYAVQLILPLGVSFAKGAKISAGSWASGTLPYQRCDAAGCYVGGAIESGALDALAHGGPKGKVTIASAGDGKALDIPLSLNGFSAARAAMENLAREKTTAAPKPAAPAKPVPGRR